MSNSKPLSALLSTTLTRLAELHNTTVEELRELMDNPDAESGHNPPPNTSQATGLQKTEVIEIDDPRVALVDTEDAMREIAKLGFVFAQELSRDRLEVLAEVLREGGWADGEFHAACRAIRQSSDLGQRITYDRAITPNLFNEARTLVKVRTARILTGEQALRLCGGDPAKRSAAFKPVRVEGRERLYWFIRDISILHKTRQS